MDEETFTVTTRAGREVVVVAARGEIDFHTSILLRSELWNAIEQTAEPLVVLDASGVGFVSSAGLAVLVTTAQFAERCQKRFLVVTGPRSVIPRALHIAGLDRMVSTRPAFPDDVAETQVAV